MIAANAKLGILCFTNAARTMRATAGSVDRSVFIRWRNHAKPKPISAMPSKLGSFTPTYNVKNRASVASNHNAAKADAVRDPPKARTQSPAAAETMKVETIEMRRPAMMVSPVSFATSPVR